MGQLQAQVLRALMHVKAGRPEIVSVGKPSILNCFILQNNGLATTNSPFSSMAEHKLLARGPRDRLQSPKPTALSYEDGKRLVDPLKYRLKPQKASSDSESVDGSESDSVVSDVGSAISSDISSEESSDRSGDAGEQDLGVRVNIRYLNCCEHQKIEQACSQIQKSLVKPQKTKPPRSPSAH